MRKIQFQVGEYYHIYNRGAEGRKIFIDRRDFLRFLTSMREFNDSSVYEQRLFLKNRLGDKKELSSKALELSSEIAEMPKLIEIVSYCLNFNHYHLLIRQLSDNGINGFMHKLGTGYTNYFNLKYKRSGSLFQGTYKAIEVKDYGYLLKLLVYVNCNHEIHNLGKAKNWPWASYLDSAGLRNGNLCNLEIIREEFDKPANFQSFCQEIIPEIKENKILRKYLLE
jgi:REP element-mobilizing transposase RayT